MNDWRALVLAVALLLAGCAAPMVEDGPARAGETGERDIPDGSEFDFADPASDRLGWEAGYWHDEPIDVDQADGLNETEQEAFVARSMARVEYIRQKEFTEDVPVSVLSREEYARRTSADVENASTSAEGANFGAWNNQVWEAMFVTGERNDSQQAIGETRSTAVAGFYSPSAGEIKIITDTPDQVVINNATLIHELVHALQDQHYDLTDPAYAGRTQDEQLAADGLVEGSARYVEKRYAWRCGSEWQCVATPPRRQGSEGGPGATAPNYGVLLTVYQPYSDGPAYVATMLERGGWGAIDRLHDDPPNSTEQTIHATAESPVPLEYNDTARDGWRRFPEQGVDGGDTLGEASMYVMFWNQARERGADTVDPRGFFRASGPYDAYDYSAPPSDGWGNDRLFPYRKGAGNDSEYGYVWVTEWDTERDAGEFRSAYESILSAHDAQQREDGVYFIENGAFADAFRVVQQGERVIIVNGPTPADVNDLRPGLAEGSE